MDVIEAVLRHPICRLRTGSGVVVQAYGKRACFGDRLALCAEEELDRHIMVRLVQRRLLGYRDQARTGRRLDRLSGFYPPKLRPTVSLFCAVRGPKLCWR